MKRALTFGFFAAITAISVFGCNSGEQNTSNSVNLNRSSANANSASNSAIIATNANSMNSSAINSNSMSMSGANPTDLQGFMTKAAQGGMAEVELARLAVSRAQNAEVKSFANKMIQDHSNANTELKSLAGKKSVTLPTEVSAEHKAVMTRLQNLSGAAFDKAYIDAMVEDHEKDVALFQAQSQSGTDADAKALATKTLPTLKMHLEMVEDIQGKLK